MFSRSQHLKGMGIEDSRVEMESSDNERTPVIIHRKTPPHGVEKPQQFAPASSESTSAAPKSREKSTSEDSGMEDADWLKFKTEFSENLHSSENKIQQSSEQAPPKATPSEFRQQLLIDAITKLHSAQQGHKGRESCQDDEGSRELSVFASEAERTKDGSATWTGSDGRTKINNTGRIEEVELISNEHQALVSRSSRKSLLSLETFDNIYESSLDHILMNIDNSDFSKNADRDETPPPPPPPKLAWSSGSQDSGNDTLMEELEKLNLTQSSVTSNTTSEHRANGPGKGKVYMCIFYVIYTVQNIGGIPEPARP